jgi:hypothetical protein
MYTIQITSFLLFFAGILTLFYSNNSQNIYGWGLMMLSVAVNFLTVIFRNKFSTENMGQNFKDNDYLFDGEIELERMINVTVTQSMILSIKKYFMQDVAVTNRRVIIFGNTFMKSLNMPKSIYYNKSEYEERKGLRSLDFYLVEVEMKNDKTYLKARSGFFGVTYSFADVEVGALVNKNFKG